MSKQNKPTKPTKPNKQNKQNDNTNKDPPVLFFLSHDNATVTETQPALDFAMIEQHTERVWNRMTIAERNKTSKEIIYQNALAMFGSVRIYDIKM
jgi:hypothetical protein